MYCNSHKSFIASSKLARAALAAVFVADAAEVRKIAKYAMFGRRFIFQPVAVEKSGANRRYNFLGGRRLVVQFHGQRESEFLLQRVSLAILRWNAFSISQSYRDWILTYLAFENELLTVICNSEPMFSCHACMHDAVYCFIKCCLFV